MRSETGRGTTFTVLLPVARELRLAPRGPSAAGAEPPHRGSGTILVADDEEAVRALVASVLDDFLPKPFSPDQLAAKVRQALTSVAKDS